MPALTYYQVDAFSDQPFRGNPAGVCLLDGPCPDAWMQNVAAEMKHSETAFLLPENDGYRLRWFTPGAEVDLCGHATLASAHILFETGRLAATAQARFYTRSGLLTASLRDGWVELNFPATPAQPAPLPDGLLDVLGIGSALYTGRTAQTQFDYLIEVSDEGVVRGLQPDFAALKTYEVRGVIVTAAGKGEYDFISRFFAPYVGVDEDPVTGSAHSTLAPYWSEKLGKDSFTAYQASARGGLLRVRLEGERAAICGQAVTVVEGKIRDNIFGHGWNG